MDRVRVWGLMAALGMFVASAWQLQRGAWATAEAAAAGMLRVAVAVAILSTVVTIGLAVAGRHRADRHRHQEQIRDALQAAVGHVLEDGGHTVSVERWSGAMPSRVRVALPPKRDLDKLLTQLEREHDPASAHPHRAGAGLDKLLRQLSQEVGKAVAARGGPRRWQARHQRLRLSPVVILTPRQQSPSEDEREVATDRVVALLKKTLPGARSVRVTKWDDGAAPAVIVATFDPNPRLSSPAVEHAILRVVADNFPGRWSASWEREKDRVTFELKPGLPRVVDRPRAMATPTELEIRYGVTADGEVQSWRPRGTAPHCLVIGPTGGGKTFALRAMALDAISQGMLVYGCDPKMIELVGFIGVPGVGQIATEPSDIADLIEYMYLLMMKRYADIRALKVRREDLQPILLIIDEFFILRMRLQREHKENDGKGEHPALGMISELLALARSAGIHLVIGIQRPDAEFLTGAARDNLRHRLSLSRLSPKGAEMMWDDQITGTDLPEIPGRAVATSSTGGPIEVQVYRVPDPDPRLRSERTAEELELLAEVFATVAEDQGPTATAPAQETPKPTRVEQLLDRRDVPPVAADLEHELDDMGEWAQVSVESLIPGDVLELDGEEITLVDVEEDPDDEDYVLLTWASGSVALPADEAIPRRHAPVGVA